MLQDTNRIEEAEPLMRRALEIDEAAFGEQHPTVAIRLNNLAMLLQDTNRIEEAEPLMRRALEIDEATFGEQHPTVAIRLNNLAALLRDTNRITEAEPLMWRALEIDEAAFGEQHPTVAIRLNNLATLLQATHRSEEAEPLMRRSLEIFDTFRRQTGHEHPHSQQVNENYLAFSVPWDPMSRIDRQRRERTPLVDWIQRSFASSRRGTERPAPVEPAPEAGREGRSGGDP